MRWYPDSPDGVWSRHGGWEKEDYEKGSPERQCNKCEDHYTDAEHQLEHDPEVRKHLCPQCAYVAAADPSSHTIDKSDQRWWKVKRTGAHETDEDVDKWNKPIIGWFREHHSQEKVRSTERRWRKGEPL